MFKTKISVPKFPNTPEPPSWNLMLEDIQSATKIDILFMLQMIHEKHSPETVSVQTLSGEQDVNVSSRVSDNDTLKLAMKFLQHREKFEEDLQILEKRRQNLNTRSLHLKETVENVKQQALTAMSKS